MLISQEVQEVAKRALTQGPSLCPSSNGHAPMYFSALEKYAKHVQFSVSVQDIYPCMGRIYYSSREIMLDPMYAQHVPTLVHELIHEFMHSSDYVYEHAKNTNRREYLRDDEIITEFVTYFFCQSIGVDSFDELATFLHVTKATEDEVNCHMVAIVYTANAFQEIVFSFLKEDV